MSEQNKQVVLNFIHAFCAGDTEASIACLNPDAVTDAKGYGKFAGIREYPTIAATIGAIKQLIPTGLRPEIKSVTAEGDRVAVEFEGNGKTIDGQDYKNHYCMVFTLRDGKISRGNEYFCNVLADRVLWPLVEKAMR